jgi:hypothetical protein
MAFYLLLLLPLPQATAPRCLHSCHCCHCLSRGSSGGAGVVACGGGSGGGRGRGTIILLAVVAILLLLTLPPRLHCSFTFFKPSALFATRRLPAYNAPIDGWLCVGTSHLHQRSQLKKLAIVILSIIKHLRCCPPPH